MGQIDFSKLPADIAESIKTLEAQAADPTLPRKVRNRSDWAAMRRKQLVHRYPRLFGVLGEQGAGK